MPLYLPDAEFWQDGDKSCWHSPSIFITSLCGYYYTEENYVKQSEKAESFGFTRLHSKKGDDGKYWEIWYLPGLWCAEGKLKEAIGDTKDWKKQVKVARDFLCHNLLFGSLEISVQRAAMVME